MSDSAVVHLHVEGRQGHICVGPRLLQLHRCFPKT